MSRSNGPATQHSAWPPQRPAAQPAGYEQDQQAWNAAQGHGQQSHGQQGQSQHGRWPAAPQAGHHGGPQGYQAAQQPGYAPYGAAQAPDPQAYAQQPGYQYPQPAEPYAPQFDPYTPPASHEAVAPQHGYAAAQPYGQAPQPAYAPAMSPSAQQAPAPFTQELSSLQRGPSAVADTRAYPPSDLRGSHYDQWSQPAYPAAPDPHGYDFGGYAAAASQSGYRPPPSLEPAHSEWPAADGHYDAYAQPSHHAGAHVTQATAGQLEPTYQHEEGVDYELEEPKAGRRWGLIAAALVGAITVGAGMTYGYRMVVGPATSGDAPVIKNIGSPAKVKPAEPGGKQFAHTDSKIMGRLNDQSGAGAAPASTASADADASGARKVQTMVIGRDGSIVATAPAPEAPKLAAASPQPVAVPGLTIVDGFGGRPPPAAIVSTSPAAPAPSEPVAPVAARPVVVNPPAAPVPAAPARPAVVAKAPSQPVEADLAPAVSKSAPKVAVPKKTAAAAAAPAPAAPAPAASGANGFVAVLASVPASQRSSMDALKQFADMQQKYGTALANKTPEVREANLGDRGIYHRLLVGPPGSREQAGQLCTLLKAAGYSSCWVTAY